jgi:3-oxoacyl-[acyl-carrier-protein] synthase II
MHHITPHPEGLGAKNVMLNCLRDWFKTTDVDGVNMHGTSTP